MHKFLLLILPFTIFAKVELVDIKKIDPRIKVQMKYFTDDNFVGEIIEGYLANKCLLSKEAASSLAKAQELALKEKLTLLVHDCYRPQRAVDHFIRWSKNENRRTKNRYYPHLDKKDLFSLGYVAKKSGHSRGSTIDLTLFDLNKHEALNMGTIYDFLDPLSNTKNSKVGEKALRNRQKLVNIMDLAGFKNYSKEWWHFTLKDELNKDKYLDIPIE